MNKLTKLQEQRGSPKEVGSAAGGPLQLVTRMGETWAGWNEEVTRFAGTRLQHDVDFGSSLMSCKDLGEVTKLQQQWLSTTFQDYTKEWSKLFRLAVSSTVPPRRSVADR